MSKLLVSQYHTEVERIIQYGGSRKETSIRVAFQNLVNEYCKPREFRLIPELDYKTPSGKLVYPDGTVKDALRLDWGYWESKDEYDNLDEEISKKLIKGYPDSNILFEDSQTAVLIQGGQETMRVPMRDADALDEIITYFINYVRPEVKDFREAIEIFLVDKDVKAGKAQGAVFNLFSRGVATQRDEWVYDLCEHNLTDKMKCFVKVYQHQLAHKGDVLSQEIKWDEDLKSYLKRGIKKEFEASTIKSSLYRPFYKQYLYFDKHFNGRTYQWFNIFNNIDLENKYIVIPGLASPKNFHSLASENIIDLNCLPAGCQCLPLYRYDKDGNRIDNITDWGLAQFQTHYNDSTITKLDIFHYTYAVLHNPAYRTKYELNLKREFPRIPFYEDFHKWVNWGKQLMDLHINYETVEPYPLKRIDLPLAKNNNSIPKAKLKADAANGTIILDDVTTLEGIPKIAWEYHLGNRCALE
jgi:hypothetical protein